MAQIAWFRGALWSKQVELASAVAAPVHDVRGKLAKGDLARDGQRAVYRYQQSFLHQGRSVTRKMLFAAVRLEPWAEGSIRAHEATSAEGRQLATKGIADEAAHSEAVLVGYRDAPRELDRVLRKYESERPNVQVSTADGTVHQLWRVASAEVFGKLRTLVAPKKLHVLDGHARYEGMLAYHAELAQKFSPPMYSSANYGLACLVNLEDPALVVAPRHRVVRAENLSKDAVLTAARPFFIIEPLPGAAKDPAAQMTALANTLAHQPAFVVLFPGDPDAWRLTLSPDIAPVNIGVQANRALQKYDPIVVEQLFFAKAVPGAVWETALEAQKVIEAVAGGALGIVQRALTIDQIVHADELGELLPFGSTAFVPPLARLVVYVVDPDEDLV